MASTNNYKLLIEAQLDPKKISAQITSLRKSTKLVLDIAFDGKSLKSLGAEIARIKKLGGTIGKIKLFEDDKGQVNKFVMEYKNKLGQVEKITRSINDKVAWTKQRYIDVNSVLKQQAKLQQDSIKLTAKQADEMGRAALSADKFLAKSQGMAQTKSVRGAVTKAEQIKVAVEDKDIAKVRQLSREFQILQAGLTRSRTGLASWANGLQDAFKRTVEYSLSVGILYGAMAKLKEGVDYIKELNTEMTKIQVLQIAGASSNKEIADLGFQYNALAKELGTTTITIAQGSVEWLRQGKTIAETGELLKATMYLSKLGNLESAQSTEYLTAILNGFQMKSEDVIDVVNKLIAVDNIAATSAGELATGLQYSSAVASDAGVSFENLVAMIGTVSSTTRLSAEMIGTAFRTMFVRMQQVKAGGIDETGMSLNNVEKVLSKVNVSLRDSKEEFRDMEDVIADVAVKWGDLSEVQKAQISNAIAGQRQAQIFSALMQNWGDAQGYLTAQTESATLAERNYAIYLESVEAAVNKQKAAWESLWQETLESGAIIWFYDLGTSIINSVSDMGGLVEVLKVVIGLLILYNAEWVYNNALMATAAVSQWYAGLRAMIAGLPTAIALVKGLSFSYASLTAAVGTANIAVASLLLALYAIGEVKKVLDMASTGLEDTALAWEAGLAKTAETAKSANEVADSHIKKMQEVQKIYDDADWLTKLFIDEGEIQSQGLAQVNKTLQETSSSYEEYIEALKRVLDSQGLMIDSQGRVYEEVQTSYGVFKEYGNTLEAVSEIEYMYKDFVDNTTDAIVENTEAVGFGQEAYMSLGETLKDMTDAQASLNDIMSQAEETGSLSFDQLDELATLYPDYLNNITIEGDKIKLNTTAVREFMLAKADLAVQNAISSGAMEEEIAVLQAYADSLRDQQTVLVDGMNVTTQLANEVFWNLANQVIASGQQFVNLEGQALNSAESIYAFLASGDQAFNSFVQQAADATGRSTQSIAQQINGMLSQTVQNTAMSINELIRMANQAGATMSHGEAAAVLAMGDVFSSGVAPSLSLGLPQYAGSGGGGGGGGGGGSSPKPKKSKADKEAERLRRIQAQIEEAQENAINSLDEQLDAYGEIIDARKKLLDSLKAERDYDRDIEDHNSEILSIQNELASLQFDMSAEAEARRRELEDDLVNAERDLEDTQFDHSIDVQQEALDAEYEAFEESITNAISQIEGITATSVSDFSSQLSAILAGLGSTPAPTGGTPPAPLQTLHDGGLAGGGEGGLKSNEVFVKLMRGEPVVTEDQADNFMKNTLPAIANSESSSVMGDINIDMPINVAGNLDKSVLPDLEKLTNGVIKKINEAMLSRGHNRRSELYST